MKRITDGDIEDAIKSAYDKTHQEPGEITIELTPAELDQRIAAAVQAEREANCATVCAICAGKYPDYGRAELISGRWEHRITEAGVCYKVQPCDASAIWARGNGSK